MKFLNSKNGFTLIELLVVIGILAVLAAIAIPSVAGLIDRANVSADQTNASEMTNAMERFVSEYELYRQDIASGLIKDTDNDGVPDNMDAAQSRVFNVTGAKTLEDIKKLESSAGFNGMLLDIDTKYAKNAQTTKTIMQNYMKTSSSTFEPKQSDMTYWYNVDTGCTVVASPNATIEELNQALPQGIVNGMVLTLTHWIDLSKGISAPEIHMLYAKYYSIQDREGILVWISISNPRFTDVDYSKIYFLAGNDSSVELSISTADDILCMQESLSNMNLDYIAKQTGSTIPLNHFHRFAVGQRDKSLQCQFRLAYEYVEDGEVKYMYTPILMTSMQELIDTNQIYTAK